MRVHEYVSGGDTKCVQAAFRMIAHAFTGRDPGEVEADRLTGFVEGRGTWQFRMLLALANMGLHVTDHEEFNVQEFIHDPVGSITKQVSDPAVIQSILEETDVEAERNALEECAAHPMINFIESVPTLADLTTHISRGHIILCNVNKRVLDKKEGREGHVLIIESDVEDNLIIHDPGLNGGLNIRLDKNLFFEAWTSPAESLANIIAVWKE